MRKVRFFLFIILLVSKTIYAIDDDQMEFSLSTDKSNNFTINFCNNPMSSFTNTQSNEQSAIIINAKESLTTKTGSTFFSGDVNLTYENRKMFADEISLLQETEEIYADGNINYQDNLITINSEHLYGNFAGDFASMTNSDYFFNARQGRGDARFMELFGQGQVKLVDSSFTTCPFGSDIWRISAKEINIDKETNTGKSYHTVFYLENIPVMYVPYFSFPLSNERKSGFLYPEASTSTTHGFDITTPYYFNIAPNYDMTLTPRYMLNQGLQIQNEMRYLDKNNEGEFAFEYLAQDKSQPNLGERYLIDIENKFNLNDRLKLHVNYSKVSDDNYLNDLGSSYIAPTNNRIERKVQFSFDEQNYNLTGLVQNYQILGPTQTPYQITPAVEFSYFHPQDFNGLEFDFYSESTNFVAKDGTTNSAQRLHIEPSISYPIIQDEGSFVLEGKLYNTYYSQESIDPNLAQNTNRTMPYFRAYSNLNFSREDQFLDYSYKQTLEPQIQYLYVPYRDQSNIGIYDSNVLVSEYDSLFRDRRYIGFDRIADANQMTIGVSSSFLENTDYERLKLSFGQILYFDQSKVSLFSDANSQITDTKSAFATQISLRATDEIYLHNSIEQDSVTNEIIKNEALIDFRLKNDKNLQFSYRHLPYISEEESVKQLGISSTFSVSNNVYLFNSYYYDLNQNRSIENYIGLQYDNCCYAFQLGYHKYIKADYVTGANSGTFDSGVFFNIIAKGFTQNDGFNKKDLLQDSLFGRLDRYYLIN